MHARLRLLPIWILVAIPFTVFAQESPPPAREISHVAGDLYKVTDGQRATVFFVGDKEILLADPLSADLLRWLRPQLEDRFPGRPIRFLVLSSHRYERAAGSGGLTKEAVIVAHEAFSSQRRAAAESLPRWWTPADRNNDNRLERSEFPALGAEAVSKDLNTDGRVTPGEAWSDVAGPEVTYGRQRVIELGDRVAALIHPGDGLGADATLLFFPKERVLFAPDVPLREAPASFASGSPSAFVAALRQIEALQFDTILSGTGETGTVGDLGALREYVEALFDGVKDGIKAGRAVEQLQTTLDLQQFSHLRNFDAQRGRNIEEVYRGLRLLTVSVVGAGLYTHLQRGVPGCALAAVPTFEVSCEGVGGPTFGGAGSADVMVGKFGGAVELSRSGAFTGSWQQFNSAPVFLEQNESVVAFMFRFDSGRRFGLHSVVTAGFATIGATQRAEGRSFFIPNYEITTRASAPIFGIDLSGSAGRLKLVIPVRVMREPVDLFRELDSLDAKWSLRVGVGIGGLVARLVY